MFQSRKTTNKIYSHYTKAMSEVEPCVQLEQECTRKVKYDAKKKGFIIERNPFSILDCVPNEKPFRREGTILVNGTCKNNTFADANTDLVHEIINFADFVGPVKRMRSTETENSERSLRPKNQTTSSFLDCSSFRASPSWFLEVYKVLNHIGRGAYGTVTKVENKENGKVYAAKAVIATVAAGQNFQKEVAYAYLMSQQGVGVPLAPENAYYFKEHSASYVVMELMDGSVEDLLLRDPGSTKSVETAFENLINLQIASGLICADQKPQNMLYKKDGGVLRIYLSDFDPKFCCSSEKFLNCETRCKDVSQLLMCKDLLYVQFSVMAFLFTGRVVCLDKFDTAINIAKDIKFVNSITASFQHYCFHAQKKEESEIRKFAADEERKQGRVLSEKGVPIGRSIEILCIYWKKKISKSVQSS